MQKVDMLLNSKHAKIHHLSQLSADPWDHPVLNSILTKDTSGSKSITLQTYFLLESASVRFLRLSTLLHSRLHKLALHFAEFIVQSKRADDPNVLSVFFGLKHCFKDSSQDLTLLCEKIDPEVFIESVEQFANYEAHSHLNFVKAKTAPKIHAK